MWDNKPYIILGDFLCHVQVFPGELRAFIFLCFTFVLSLKAFLKFEKRAIKNKAVMQKYVRK